MNVCGSWVILFLSDFYLKVRVLEIDKMSIFISVTCGYFFRFHTQIKIEINLCMKPFSSHNFSCNSSDDRSKNVK